MLIPKVFYQSKKDTIYSLVHSISSRCPCCCNDASLLRYTLTIKEVSLHCLIFGSTKKSSSRSVGLESQKISQVQLDDCVLYDQLFPPSLTT